MQRIIVVHNPRSSKNKRVDEEVLRRLRDVPGVAMGRYEVRATDVDDNAAKLALILRDKDIVVAAGGDGTATIAMNGCMVSGKDVSFVALPYGNFNDLARISGIKDIAEMVDNGKMQRRGRVVEAWPLEVLLDGKHWRYALGYVTIGLFAESTAVFDEKEVREQMKKGNKTPMFSWITLAKWYFRNRKKREFLPDFELNGRAMPAGTTDYVAANAPRMGKVMRGGDWYRDKKEFYSGVANLRGFGALVKLMLKSMTSMMPIKPTTGDELKFDGVKRVMIQAEGEYAWVEAKKIKIRKAKRSLKLILAGESEVAANAGRAREMDVEAELWKEI